MSRSTGRSRPQLSGNRPRFVSADCEARTLYIPKATLARIEGDAGPLAFLELVTVLLTAHLAGKGVTA